MPKIGTRMHHHADRAVQEHNPACYVHELAEELRDML
jgi:hypothetical protein